MDVDRHVRYSSRWSKPINPQQIRSGILLQSCVHPALLLFLMIPDPKRGIWDHHFCLFQRLFSRSRNPQIPDPFRVCYSLPSSLFIKQSRTRTGSGIALYRVVTVAASRDCGETSLLLSLVQLGLLRAHDHRNLANRCSHRKTKPDFGLKCLFKPYIGPSPYLGGSGPRSGVLGCLRWVPSSVWHRLRPFQCLKMIPNSGCIS
jgi:hypothetical protein